MTKHHCWRGLLRGVLGCVMPEKQCPGRKLAPEQRQLALYVILGMSNCRNAGTPLEYDMVLVS